MSKKYTCTIIGRIKKRITGLSRVSYLFNEMLQDAAWEVNYLSDNNFFNYKKEIIKSNLIILSGDSSVNINSYKLIRDLTDVPILSLSLFRNSLEDKREIKRLEDLNKKFNNIYFAIWDYSYYNTALFDTSNVKDKIIVLPKPILSLENSKNNLDYKSREGICIGHSIKTFNKRFSGRSSYDELNNVEDAIIELQSAFPDIPFITYGNTKNIFNKNIKIVNPENALTSSFLPSIRMFISLQSNETFYLVPLEAQASGVPVLYRHMPQSLTHYVGNSGLIISNVNDIKYFIKKIYYNEKRWGQLSKISILNSKNIESKNRSEIIKIYLEKLIDNYR